MVTARLTCWLGHVWCREAGDGAGMEMPAKYRQGTCPACRGEVVAAATTRSGVELAVATFTKGHIHDLSLALQRVRVIDEEPGCASDVRA